MAKGPDLTEHTSVVAHDYAMKAGDAYPDDNRDRLSKTNNSWTYDKTPY